MTPPRSSHSAPPTISSSVAHLLRHLTLRLARLWLKHAPAELQSALPPLDFGALEHAGFARTPLLRQQQLHSAVSVSAWVVEALRPCLAQLDAPLRSAVSCYLEAIAKVKADELIIDADGLAQEREPKQRGQRRIASAVDLEATFRKHEGSEAVLGTNAVISATATRIRACVALTGCTPDSQAPLAALQQQREASLPLPPELIMDQAGGWGKVRAEVDVLSEGHTLMVAKIPSSGGSDPKRFTVADFKVDAERTRCTCPNGVVSTKAYAQGDGDGVSFRFLASQCQGCPFWCNCRDEKANPKGHRSVFFSDYQVYLRRANEYNHTTEGQALLASRWRIEPTIAWLVRYQGCREARRVGTAAAQSQLYWACGMRNLLMWLNRVRRGQAPRPC